MLIAAGLSFLLTFFAGALLWLSLFRNEGPVMGVGAIIATVVFGAAALILGVFYLLKSRRQSGGRRL